MHGLKPFADAFPPDNLRHHFAGGVYAKELRIPAGFKLVSHRHEYDHLSVLAFGTVLWSVGDAVPEVLNGPCAITVAAGAEHTLHAISDAVWFCVHATDATDADQVDAAILEKQE